MSEVLIVSRTQMWGNKHCIGGLILDSNRSVRLMNQNKDYHHSSAPYQVGEVWNIDFNEIEGQKAPHVEGVAITGATKTDRSVGNLRTFLIDRCSPWTGNPAHLFEGKILFKNNKPYVVEKNGLPSVSTGYWLPDKPLTFYEDTNSKGEKRPRYRYGSGLFTKTMPFVGFQKPLDVIPPGILVRVSLARPMPEDKNPSVAGFCYLQVSGWYL